MSIAQILQVLIIANGALADALVGPPNVERIGGVVDILGMLENTLSAQVKGGGVHA